MHTFRDTGGIDLAEQSSSAKNAERMLKREPRKNLLSGTTEWNRELGGVRGGLAPLRRMLTGLRRLKFWLNASIYTNLICRLNVQKHYGQTKAIQPFKPYRVCHMTHSDSSWSTGITKVF